MERNKKYFRIRKLLRQFKNAEERNDFEWMNNQKISREEHFKIERRMFFLDFQKRLMEENLKYFINENNK